MVYHREYGLFFQNNRSVVFPVGICTINLYISSRKPSINKTLNNYGWFPSTISKGMNHYQARKYDLVGVKCWQLRWYVDFSENMFLLPHFFFNAGNMFILCMYLSTRCTMTVLKYEGIVMEIMLHYLEMGCECKDYIPRKLIFFSFEFIARKQRPILKKF